MAGMPCLVIGGGHVALRKIRVLLEEGASVTVAAPAVSEEMERLFLRGDILWRKETYKDGMCDGFFLVITAAGNKEIAESIGRQAKCTGFLYNAADFPSEGNCHIPARIKKDGIMITVSTEGRSPAMAKYVKNWLAGQIPSGYGLWLDKVSVLRESLKGKIEKPEHREMFWRMAFSREIMELVIQGNLDQAEECLRRGISSFRSES